jgi:hypothetical protein
MVTYNRVYDLRTYRTLLIAQRPGKMYVHTGIYEAGPRVYLIRYCTDYVMGIKLGQGIY